MKKEQKEISYMYWKAPKQDLRTADSYQPKKINAEEAQAIESLARQNSKGSSWNSLGTWEEKKVPCEALKTYLQNRLKTALPFSGEWILKNLLSLSGECSQVFSKGRTRLGFDLSLSLQYAHSSDSATEGTIEFKEITDDSEGDFEYTLSEIKGKDINEVIPQISKWILSAIKEYS